MFADDTNLFMSGKSLSEVSKQINEDMIILSDWFRANLLSLNIKKTFFFILFTNKIYYLTGSARANLLSLNIKKHL